MRPNPQPSLAQIVRGYLALPHDMPIVVVLAATALFALVASDGWPGAGAMARLLGAMLGGQLAIGAVNELVDAKLDAVAKPRKPIPAGLVSIRGARLIAAGGLVLMAMLGVTFGTAPILLLCLGTGIGIAYSLVLKSTIWSWVAYLIALPLMPIWVWSALSEVEAGTFAIYPIGAAAAVAVQLAQSLPDIETDRAAGVRTLAVALGTGHALVGCWGALLLAGLLACALAPALTDNPARVWVAAAAATALVGINVIVWLRDAAGGTRAAFPCVASAAVLLGVGWTAALAG
jgi:4-hydroxybenzoate polyprenyltransferase